MTWFGWFLIAWLTLSTLTTIGMVGRPRDSVNSSTAVIVTVSCGLLVLGILLVGTNH